MPSWYEITHLKLIIILVTENYKYWRRLEDSKTWLWCKSHDLNNCCYTKTWTRHLFELIWRLICNKLWSECKSLSMFFSSDSFTKFFVWLRNEWTKPGCYYPKYPSLTCTHKSHLIGGRQSAFIKLLSH